MCTDAIAQRIIGGLVVKPHTHPYQGSIQATGLGDPKPYCGATLITDQWAVSAAHCWRPWVMTKYILAQPQFVFECDCNSKKPVHFISAFSFRTSAMIIVFGEHNLWIQEGYEQIFNVSKIYLHNFNYNTFNNDIMLLKVRVKYSHK